MKLLLNATETFDFSSCVLLEKNGNGLVTHLIRNASN